MQSPPMFTLYVALFAVDVGPNARPEKLIDSLALQKDTLDGYILATGRSAANLESPSMGLHKSPLPHFSLPAESSKVDNIS
jgi:hypothetical protein